MKNTISTLTLLGLITTALSACAPMPPQGAQGPSGPMGYPYTPNPTPYYPGQPGMGQPYPVPSTPVSNNNIPTTGSTGSSTQAATGQYVVQLTATANAAKAETVKAQFASAGYQTFINPLMVNGNQLYRVQIGYFNDQQQAKAALAQLQGQFPGDAYVAGALVKTP